MTKSSVRIAALLAALVAQCICTARAELSDVQRLENMITATGATKIYLNGTTDIWTNSIPDGAEFDNLVFVFNNPAVASSLTLNETVRADARILVVGGGGAGGTSRTTTLGTGGGGGAGGFIEATRKLDGGAYTITVGAGGPQYTGSDDVSVGEDGQASSFDEITALGGGGGGAQCAGNDGGSGGGGSRASTASSTPNGGGGEEGQGNNGGNGATAKYGAGGGGAGAVGGNTTSTKGPGAGGKGLASDITGEELFYAGGGGGGSTSIMKSSGGKGGGGAGAVGGNSAKAAGDGEDGKGGGGGGGNDSYVGGKGGDGIVVVRITNLFESKVSVPVIADKTYDKGNQIALVFGSKYTYVDGVTNATGVGSYTFRVMPGTDCEWVAADGGGTDAKTVTWKILPRLIEKPEVAEGLAFTGSEQNGVAYTADCAAYCTFTATSVTNATDAGIYPYSVALDDTVNTTWADGTTDDISGSWTIAAAKVDRPTLATTSFTYDSNAKTVLELSGTEQYELASGTLSATDGGNYTFTLALKGNTATVTNYVWNVNPATPEPYVGDWAITPAANSVTKPELAGWRINSTPNVPTATATWGAIAYFYGYGATEAEVTEWISDPNAIASEGTWIVMAAVDATENWNGATNTSTFVMWDDPTKLFRDYVEIKISAPSGATTTLTNFPALVRISEERLIGFSYDRAGSDSSKITFLDGDKNPLPYDVEKWNTSGESLVWVKIPLLPPEGATITFYWNLKEGRTPPTNTPSEVWADYAVVVHGGSTIVNAVDNGLDVKPGSAGTVSGYPQDGAIAGSMKKAAYNSIGLNVDNPSGKLTDAGVFSVSAWFMRDGNGGAENGNGTHILASSKNDWGTVDSGFVLLQEKGKCLSVATASGHVFDTSTTRTILADKTWGHVAFSYANTTHEINKGVLILFLNGAPYLAKTNNINNTLINTSNPYWTFGSYENKNSNDSFRGNMDEIRVYNGAASVDWIKAEYETVANGDFTSQGSAVSRDGVKINYWISLPAMDKTSWDVSETPGAITNAGELAYCGVTNYIYSVYDPTQSIESMADLTAAGYYRAVFLPTETEGYEPISYEIDIHVVESQPYTKIGGTNGDSGRVLLMNRDTNTQCPINYQGYDTTGKNNSTFWAHLDKDADTISLYNLQKGTESTLWTKNYGARLWHLVNARHGNTVPEFGKVGTKTVNGVTDKDGKKIPATATTTVPLDTAQNYLPYSTTSYSIKQSLVTRANPSTEGQVVMRNMGDPSDAEACAVVYSSCFTNGIGTIYFDAVNGWCRKDYFTQEIIEDFDNYKIVVEIATNTVEGLVPMDDNSFTIETNYVEEAEIISTNWYGRLEGCWTPVSMIPFKRDGTANFEKGEKTEVLTLDVVNGGTMDNFFRVVVQLDIPGYVRFRIRRVSRVPSSSFGVDDGGFILLDNIIASIPAMSADLVSAGHYEAEKTGAQTLGWELTTSVPYPSISDDNLIVYATPKYTVNAGDGSTPDTSTFFASATMHYRWRYLNQTLNQPVSAWKTVDLNPKDNFKSVAPLELPSRVGDVEYWFEYGLQAPYYKYVDYSGAANAEIDYTEERGVLTNHLNDPTVPTGGSDWFFRLREGKSDYSGLDVVFRRGSSAAEERVHLSLVDDHVWRGFVQTKENQTGEISYRIEALDEQTAEFAEYAAKTNYWRCNVDNPRFPVSEALVPVGEGSWSKLTLDATTGYVMFQIDDTEKSSMALTVVHADYQNANGWSDALGRKDSQGRGPIFVGTSTTNAYKIGVSPSKQTFSEDFSSWGTMVATNDSWTFPTGLTDIQPSHMYGRTAYEPFISDQNGLWDVGPGMWVAKKYMISSGTDAGVGLQMEGQGKGFFQFIDKDTAPRGVESIEFNARLAQSIAFEDFNYYDGDVKTAMTNYTFISRVAYDLAGNKFTGNASLSLVADYLPNKGCYEARWEWISNPNNQKKGGQRLCLYRWNFTSEGRNATLLTAWTNGVNNANAAFEMAAPTALNDTQTFMPFYITVSNANSRTWVAAGVCMTKQNLKENSFPSGSTWNIVACNDNSSQRLKCGTFGVLSTNCKGFFGKPQYSPNVMFTAADELKLADGKAGFYTQKARTAPDGIARRTQGFGTDDTNWNILPGRMTTTNVTSDACGVVAAPVPQTLSIYFGTPGRADWGSPATNVVVNNFGGDRFVLPIYKTEACSIRFGVGGTSSSTRRDIAVDSVVLNQWRGGNWDDPDVWPILPAWADDQHRNKAVGHTNFVFTSAWTTNHTVLLSAKRAGLDMPSAVRSPLMDGFADDGSHGTGYVRGIGLGMISLAYENAQENAVLSLQIATNGVDYTTIGGYDKSFSTNIWTTITNFNFSSMTAAQRKKGILNTYLGLHDVKGAMRVMVPTNTILTVKNTTDTSKFGDVTITSITCSDEPPVDVHSWWGWNIRTVGGDQDSEKMMFLDDFSTEAGGSGLSLAINNSVDETYEVSQIDVSDRESYIQHKPFVQTPTFTSNIVGEVVFRARKYGENDPTATVTVYGSRNATETDEGKWERIDGAVFMVSNAWYETYRAKMDPRYKAFRLAVAGVEGVVENSDGGGNGLPVGAYDPPPRVLLDEMFVSEAVNAIMGFKNVGCFRHDMSGLGEVPNVPSRDEQPICEEAWGVQCEIYGAQLASDIDFTHTPRVKLHWFNGIAPWGYENWKDSPGANSAWLSRAIETEEDRFVYRSTMRTSPDAVVPMSFVAPSYVQYTLEVVFYTKENPTVPVTNWLASSDWKIPEWYRPLDLNAQYGNGTDFAAYNILDNVAPGWAWINEVNLFGDFVKWNNTDENCQFVEIAHPPEADVSGWSVRLLEGQMGNNWVITNDLARFGRDGLSGTKQLPAEDAEVNMVFRVIGSPLSRSSGRLKKSDGTLDGVWKVDNPTQVFTSDGVISYYDPVVFQLVRTSGIVEHEIIVEGTNYLESLEIESPGYLGEMRDWMAARMPGSDVVMAGYDFGGPANSLSVTQHFGRCGMTVAPDDWNHPTNDWKTIVKMTPGHRNVGQVIDPNHPVPAGEEVLVYFTVAGDHIEQSLDGSNFTNGMFSAIVTKNNPVGTNVVYRVDPWYVLDNVRTGSVSLVGQVQQTKTTQPFEYTLPGVAKGVSNNVTVVATAALNPKFGTDWGVPEDDPYRDAIIDWLEGGTDLYGNPFSDVESGEIRLATHRSWWSGAVMTNLTLREMYWLDMDPTVGKLSLLAGTAFDPNGIEHVVTKAMGESTVVMTNRRLYVYMMISNENETVEAPVHPRGIHDFTTHWTPYVLRGLEPGEHSQNYVVSTGEWESVTFKITGMLMNGATSFYVTDNKVPLRHFTFNENSFSAEGLSKVEVYDPYSPLSVGYNAGWKRWWDKNGYCPVVFFWMIDTRLPPIGVEQLQEDNYYGD